MEFDPQGDVNDEPTATIEERSSRSGDKNEIGDNSVRGVCLVEQDNKECLGKDEVTYAVPTQSVGPGDEPYVGQEFETEAAAHGFYNAYATRAGFVIRVSKLSWSRCNGSPIGRALVCNKEGFRMPEKREKIIRQRAEMRVGCRAMILVRKEEEIYEQFPNEHDKIRELTQQLATEKRRATTYKRHLELLFEQIEEHNESLSTKINHIIETVREFENKEQQR